MASRRKKADADYVYNSVETLKLASSAAVTRMALTALCKHSRFPSCVKGSFTLSKHQEDHVTLGFSKGPAAQIGSAPLRDGAL